MLFDRQISFYIFTKKILRIYSGEVRKNYIYSILIVRILKNKHNIRMATIVFAFCICYAFITKWWSPDKGKKIKEMDKEGELRDGMVIEQGG